MTDGPPTFHCAACRTGFTSTEKDDAPEADPEKVAKLKTAWEGACARLEADKSLPGIWEQITTAKLEAAEVRASIAYFGAIRKTNVWKVPDDLVSERGHNGWRLVCKTCKS